MVPSALYVGSAPVLPVVSDEVLAPCGAQADKSTAVAMPVASIGPESFMTSPFLEAPTDRDRGRQSIFNVRRVVNALG